MVTSYTGAELLNTPHLNKGTAFSEEERREFGLEALLPPAVHSLEQQLDRAWSQYKTQTSDLARNTFLTSLKEQNEVLYYRLVLDHLSEVFSIVYTPTEGEAIQNYSHILDQYRSDVPCFNDDVQGTGCVTLAAIVAALRVSNQGLPDLRMVVFGAGSAGVGIADQVRDAIAAERKISKDEAAEQIWLVDKPGLLTTETESSDAQKGFLKDASQWKGKDRDLMSVVKNVKPNVLIGTSTVPGSFTKEIVQEMARHVQRPIVLPLSNPTRLHEAVPKDLLHWTDGKALVATGSPFDPVKGPWGKDGKEIEIVPAECNNSVVFPGIALGSVLSRAKLVTDEMLVAAVEGVASMAPSQDDPTAPLLPGVDIVRKVSVRVARNVIKAAVKGEVSQQPNIPEDDEKLDAWIKEQMWQVEYRPLKLKK